MRVLFAGLASAGHTFPMVPLAAAAREAGHDVHFAVGEEMHAPLAAKGLNPFRPADAFYQIYAEDLEPDLNRLKPDLVVHGWGVPGAAIAARRAGIPGIWHGFGRMFPDRIGLELPESVVAGLPHLDICPPSLQDKVFLASVERIKLRPVPFSPAGVWEPKARPLIYLTMGTAFATAELLGTAIKGLSKLGVEVVVASGPVRPEQLGSLPPNVSVQTWVPQAQLWPHVDVVVHHGGSGTTLGALAAGVPQLMLPQGADQFTNAQAVSAAEAGIHLLPGELTAEAVADQTRKLLPYQGNSSHRDAARAIAEEIARMPSPGEVASRLLGQAGRGG
ncbi:MAG TPA: glycosyltransferase [Candidatus Limnocylindrales bacterium]|nr:glycosyltransferase [Candidatus Limnocylindrales bacterium]